MKYLIAITLGFLLCADLAPAKIYERCDLARELYYTYHYERSTLGDWICLIQWESNYDTAAVGNLNTDGSLDNGLYQINDRYWCNDDIYPGGDCNIQCSQLLDDDISDDVTCSNLIYSKMGFPAWNGWKAHCQGQDTESYVSDCGL